jgi:putative Flp pilus-assembly TadE/G-like protein
MKHNNTEKGQALVIIALAAVVLIGFAALAIDGSTAFSDRRHAQNAADTAALAGALAFTRGNDITAAATARATANNYKDNGTTKLVTVTITDLSHGECPGKAPGKDIEVKITSVVNTTFARILGRTQFTNVVRATARGCGYIVNGLFPGNAIVSLNPAMPQNSQYQGCGFNADSSATNWTVVGGGIFSNGCADSHDGSTVTLDPGECVTTAYGAQNFTCDNTDASQQVDYPNGVLAMMPPNPCDHTTGDVGLPQSSGITSGNTVSFNSGVYCISDMDALDSKDIVLDNATLYVTDTVFNLKFSGGGGFSGTPTQEGTYSNYYMIIAMTNPPCTDFQSQNSQVIVYRGNGSGELYGTVLAPSACIDFRGNAQTQDTHSQLIGYNVSSNGSGDVYIDYQADENHQNPYEPFVTLRK